MALKKIRLGDLIEEYNAKNIDCRYSGNDVVGISTAKTLINTKANLDGVPMNSYKILPNKYFAYVSDTSRRGDKISLAYNEKNKTVIVSSISTVFKVANSYSLLSDYLFMYFNRPEFDRYSRFNSWGSARETFSWEDFCDIEIDLPDLATQQKYVDIYNAMKANQKAYERGGEEICLSLEAEFAKYKLENLSHIYNFIEVYSKKNYNKKVPFQQLRGINENGDFVKTRDSIRENDIDKYLVIENKSFAVNFMCLGNFGKFYLGYNDFGEEYLVSPACNSFKIKTDMLNPHYFLFILRREEFQRLCVYMGDGNTRGGINIGNFLDIKIPLPPIQVQESIANIYKCYEQRKEINEQLKEKIRDICPILIKGSIDEARGN